MSFETGPTGKPGDIPGLVFDELSSKKQQMVAAEHQLKQSGLRVRLNIEERETNSKFEKLKAELEGRVDQILEESMQRFPDQNDKI